MSKKEVSPRKKCSKCGKLRYLSRDYYMSNSDKHSDSRVSICKPCINKDLEVVNEDDYMDEGFIKKVQDVLLEMNRPYIHSVWISSVEEAKRRKWGIFGVYMKNINLQQNRDKNWRDSEFDNSDVSEGGNTNSAKGEKSTDKQETVKKKHEIELDTQNEKDVLRLLGYDPFGYESEDDRSNLFNKLIDYLDESTLEDGFKLTSVIEIVRTFNQVDKINAAISETLSGKIGDTRGVTGLVNAKDKMMKTILNIAQENGISIRHATNKSQGAGTLSGILNQLRDFDFHEAGVNLFDIETADGIKQVADISNKSITNQLQYDENDYTEMINEQRELIDHFEKRAKKSEEEARLLRVELEELRE